jgi:hypothetical protein
MMLWVVLLCRRFVQACPPPAGARPLAKKIGALAKFVMTFRPAAGFTQCAGQGQSILCYIIILALPLVLAASRTSS